MERREAGYFPPAGGFAATQRCDGKRALSCSLPRSRVSPPIPLIAKAASARLAYLDAERAANVKSMTPGALKRLTDREIERMEEAQAGFELRVAERATTLERRCEAGEEAVGWVAIKPSAAPAAQRMGI